MNPLATLEGENELQLTYQILDEGIVLLRCQTADAIVTLPDTIEGQPVYALGDYVCSARAPTIANNQARTLRITCGGIAPTEHQADNITHIRLPMSLKRVGSYAFYNCRALHTIEIGNALTDIGGSVLMNCRALHTLVMHTAPDAPSCLPKLLSEFSGELTVRFETAQGLTSVFFPAYDEELEDLTPAHVFTRHIQGAGYAYRQCFENGVLHFSHYDHALTELLDRHDFTLAARVALHRLRTPFSLSVSARIDYLDCLREHGKELVCALAQQGDTTALSFVQSLGVLSADTIEAASNTARTHGQTAALSVLLAAGYGQQRGRAKSYDL